MFWLKLTPPMAALAGVLYLVVSTGRGALFA